MNKFSIFIIALIVSISFGLPHILIPILQKGDSYTPLVVKNVSGLTWDETYLYAAKIKKVYDGNLICGDTDLVEYKNKLTPFPILPSIVLGLLSHITGSVERTFILGDFLFPTIIFFMFYLLFLQLTADRLVSVMGGAVIIFGYHFWNYFPFINVDNLRSIAWSILNFAGGKRPLELSRLDTPQFSLILLVASVYFLFKAIREEKTLFSLLSGLLFGLLFYSYFYYWTFFGAGTIMLGCLHFIRGEWRKLKKVVIALIIGMVISIPYWIWFLDFRSLPWIKDIFLRGGMSTGRILLIPETHIAWLMLFTIFYKKRDDSFYLCVAFFIGGILCLNIQILTSYTIQQTHWIQRTNLLWLALMCIILLNRLITSNYTRKRIALSILTLRKQFYKPFCAFMIFFFLCYGLYTHTRFAILNYKNFMLPQDRQKIFKWLNRHTPIDSVVASCSLETNYLLPLYTHNRIFLPAGIRTLASNEEILNRLFIIYKLYNVPPSYLAYILSGASESRYLRGDFLENETAGLIYLFHHTYYDGKKRRYEMPLDLQKEIVNKYISFHNNIKKLLNKEYKLDYIILSNYERKISRGLRLEKLNVKKVYEQNDISIYQLIKSEDQHL
jgi:hypothetical protein